MAAKFAICKEFGMKLTGIDFNEAQKGKDQCDRDGAVAKRAIRSYVSEGNDVISAVQVKEALDNSSGSLKNSKSSVINVETSKDPIEKAKG